MRKNMCFDDVLVLLSLIEVEDVYTRSKSDYSTNDVSTYTVTYVIHFITCTLLMLFIMNICSASRCKIVMFVKYGLIKTI